MEVEEWRGGECETAPEHEIWQHGDDADDYGGADEYGDVDNFGDVENGDDEDKNTSNQNQQTIYLMSMISKSWSYQKYLESDSEQTPRSWMIYAGIYALF